MSTCYAYFSTCRQAMISFLSTFFFSLCWHVTLIALLLTCFYIVLSHIMLFQLFSTRYTFYLFVDRLGIVLRYLIFLPIVNTLCYFFLVDRLCHYLATRYAISSLLNTLSSFSSCRQVMILSCQRIMLFLLSSTLHVFALRQVMLFSLLSTRYVISPLANRLSYCLATHNFVYPLVDTLCYSPSCQHVSFFSACQHIMLLSCQHDVISQLVEE